MRTALAVVLASMLGASARAETYMSRSFVGGLELLKQCEATDFHQFECIAYIEGVSDSLAASKPYVRTPCPPQGVLAGQLQLVVERYLRSHPGKLHETAAGLVYQALIESFPCS